MQGEETNTKPPATLTEPASDPVLSVLVPQVDTQDDDPDELVLNAVAELDTQPLVKHKKGGAITRADVLQTIVCVSLIGVGLFGLMWQAITYPHMLVILFASEKPASITVALAIPTRTLAPVTVSRSQTAPTTGKGHQDARAATGRLTFYNGSANPQYVPVGSVFTGNDGVKVTTEQSITVPAANLPAIGSKTVSASALLPGRSGNIAALDINVTVSSVLKAENDVPFTHGRDARDFRAVAEQDVQSLTSTVQKTLATAFTTAFPLRSGEQAQPTNCHTTTTADHGLGDEATTVTVKAVQTCSALAYSQDTLEQRASAVFTATRPGAQYKLVGSLTPQVVSVAPLTVHLTGVWVYVLSQEDEQSLAQAIQGDTPAQARTYLLSTGVISRASVPDTLPPAMYIHFLVLVGKNT